MSEFIELKAKNRPHFERISGISSVHFVGKTKETKEEMDRLNKVSEAIGVENPLNSLSGFAVCIVVEGGMIKEVYETEKEAKDRVIEIMKIIDPMNEQLTAKPQEERMEKTY